MSLNQMKFIIVWLVLSSVGHCPAINPGSEYKIRKSNMFPFFRESFKFSFFYKFFKLSLYFIATKFGF